MREKKKPDPIISSGNKLHDPLPWEEIQTEIILAVRSLPEKRFINVKDIVDYVNEHPGKHPNTLKRSEWYPHTPLTDKSLTTRIDKAIKMMAWKQWNTNGCNRTGRIYLVPWVEEDPFVVRIREEGRAGTA